MASVLDWMLGTSAATIQIDGHPRAGLIGFGTPTASGVEVNENTLLNYSAAWCATVVICEAESRVPFPIYRRLPDGGKSRIPDNPIARLLRGKTNPKQTAMTFREVMTERALNCGVAYAEIERNGGGQVIGLYPIHPSRVTPDGNNWKVTTSKGTVPLDASDMFVLTGRLGGKGVIPYGKESIGSAMAAEQHGATFFGNNATPAGLLKHKGQLGDTARANIRKEWNEVHGGASNAGKIGILWEGMEYQQLSINNEQAQYLETRQHNISEIARWYNITPHKLHDLTHATFSNVEHLQIAHVLDTILPWCVRWEQAVNTQLLDDSDEIFAEHLIDGLLRGDTASRFAAYAVALLNGWMTINEVRRLENMNPIGPEGDVHRVPLNQVPVGEEDRQAKEVVALLHGMAEGSRSATNELAALLKEHESASTDRATAIGHALGEFSTKLSAQSDAIAGSTKHLVESTVAHFEPIVASAWGAMDDTLKACNESLGSQLAVKVHEDKVRVASLVRAAAENLADTMGRVLTKEGNAVKRAASAGGNFLAWMEEFYGEHCTFMAEALRHPLQVALLASGDSRHVADLAPQLASLHCEQSKAELLSDADGDREKFVERITARVDSWQSRKNLSLENTDVAS